MIVCVSALQRPQVGVGREGSDCVCALQRPQVLGVQRERRLMELVKENRTLLKLGIFMESRALQNTIHEFTERNHDNGERLLQLPTWSDVLTHLTNSSHRCK